MRQGGVPSAAAAGQRVDRAVDRVEPLEGHALAVVALDARRRSCARSRARARARCWCRARPRARRRGSRARGLSGRRPGIDADAGAEPGGSGRRAQPSGARRAPAFHRLAVRPAARDLPEPGGGQAFGGRFAARACGPWLGDAAAPGHERGRGFSAEGPSAAGPGRPGSGRARRRAWRRRTGRRRAGRVRRHGPRLVADAVVHPGEAGAVPVDPPALRIARVGRRGRRSRRSRRSRG